MKSKDEYIAILVAEVKVWSAQIDLLAFRSEAATEELKLKYTVHINALRANQQAATEKIKELEEGSSETWEIAEESADKIGDDVKWVWR